MKKFTKTCAQGDIYIRKVDALPSISLVIEQPENGNVIVTHSETGHHHIMDGDVVTMYRPQKQESEFDWDAWLFVAETAELKHLRTEHTHESIMFEPGIYHVRRQREYTPEGLRRVAD